MRIIATHIFNRGIGGYDMRAFKSTQANIFLIKIQQSVGGPEICGKYR